jgi:glycosyltransferase involved in cell wall biosynthesis
MVPVCAAGKPVPSLLLAGNFLSGGGGSRGPIEDLADQLMAGGASVICTSRFRNGWVRAADLVSTAIVNRSRYQAGVVDLYSGNAFLWGEALSIVLKALGRPFVMVLHGGGLPEFAERHQARVRACLARATAVTAPSRFLVDAMRPYRQDIELLPNPLQIGTYPFRVRERPKPVLVWLRAFHSIYNPELAPRTVALLAAEFPDVKMMMVGPDKGDGSLARTQQVAAQLGILDRMQFPGGVARSEVPAWLRQGDIFVNTTDVDNTPVSVLEAMACGLCVVSTNVGGIPKLLADGKDALLVPRNDPEAMATAIRRLLTEPDLAETLSREARRTAERFDWSIVLPRWQALLGTLSRN